jgi:hypothetical protein
MVDLLLLDALSQHLLSFLHHGQDPGLSLVRPDRQEVTSLKNNSKNVWKQCKYFLLRNQLIDGKDFTTSAGVKIL